jgi:hypothetical protein
MVGGIVSALRSIGATAAFVPARLRDEVLKIIEEPRLKAQHAVRMMAALFVLDNFKIGVGRQQTDGVFIPKSCSEPFLASNELCWAQERSLS